MSTWIRELVFACAVVAAGASCGKSAATASKGSATGSGPAAGSGSATGSGSGTAAAAGTVALFVNNQAVGQVSAAQLASWPRLDTLVPVSARRMGAWDDLFVQGAEPKPAELHRPTDQHPDLVPALFPGEGGEASFGMFDPVELAKHGEPQIREDHVHEIRIKLSQNSGRGQNDDSHGAGSDPTTLVIDIVTPKGKSQLTGKQLLAIPRVPLPGETGAGRGWTLATILDTAGVKQFQRLLLTDAAGLNLTLDRKDFDAKTTVPFIKLNRQGSLRFNLFKKQGEGWQRQGDLRGLVSIEVLK